jgi:YbgC/YbaW family acyl-CoA thioester hydrolase
MHRTVIAVRWAELDPYYHVNHATYLSYLEHARIAALDDIGWGMAHLEAAGFRVVVVGVEVRFRAPATAGDRLEVVSSVVDLGASASTWHQSVTRDGADLVEATVDAACTDLDGRPVRMPDPLRRALSSLMADSPDGAPGAT